MNNGSQSKIFYLERLVIVAEWLRGFIKAVMQISETGSPWRALPSEYGIVLTFHKRFMKWTRSLVWQKIFNTLAANKDNKWLFLDLALRTHNHLAVARKKKIIVNPFNFF